MTVRGPLPTRRERAFLAFCDAYNYADDDREAPHVEAFFAGYAAGMSWTPPLWSRLLFWLRGLW